jgi:hypothetical protein
VCVTSVLNGHDDVCIMKYSYRYDTIYDVSSSGTCIDSYYLSVPGRQIGRSSSLTHSLPLQPFSFQALLPFSQTRQALLIPLHQGPDCQ